jgi:hypothetical protein
MTSHATTTSQELLMSRARYTSTADSLVEEEKDVLACIPTTLSVRSPLDRDYAPVLAQTEVVYDALLAEQHEKLVATICRRRAEFEEKLGELVSAGEHEKAGEFKRWADTALAQLKQKSVTRLQTLREDYERNYIKLWQSLEAQWQANLPPTRH